MVDGEKMTKLLLTSFFIFFYGTIALAKKHPWEKWHPSNNTNIKIDNTIKLENTPSLNISRKKQKNFSIEKESSVSLNTAYIFGFYFMPNTDFLKGYGKIYINIKCGNNTARASWKGRLIENEWHYLNLMFSTDTTEKIQIKIICKGPGSLRLSNPRLNKINPPEGGIDLSKQYLRIPFGTRFDNKIFDHLNVKKGTIEFWLCPNWAEKDHRYFVDKEIHTLFFWGDTQYDNSISIYSWNKFPNIYFALCGKNHRQGTLVFYYNTPERGWRKNMWHHLAACWKQEGEYTHMTLFVDGMPCGKKIAKTIIRHYLKRDIFIGAGKKRGQLMLNRMADSSLAMLRISNTIKYTKPFTPQKYDIDNDTLCFFPLCGDNDLTGFVFITTNHIEKFKATKKHINKNRKVNK